MTAPPDVLPDLAQFYEGTNFQGEMHIAEIGPITDVPIQDNDQYKSVNIGEYVKVIGFRDYGTSSVFREWTGVNPDITDLGGLSQYQVQPISAQVLAISFKDTSGAPTGNKPKAYILLIKSYENADATLYSNDPDEEYGIVCIVPENGQNITVALYVKDAGTDVDVCNGSVYFRWNNATGEIDIDDSASQIPNQLETTKTGPTRFEFTLIDNKP